MIFSGLYLLRHSTTLSTLSIRLNSVFSDIILSQLVQKIVLFGSLAEGKAIPGSDVDLLIVLEDKRKIFERISEFLGYFSDLGTAIDVFPYNENELNNPIAEYALRDGRVLFERRLRKGQQE